MTYWPAGMKTEPLGVWPGERTVHPQRSPFSAMLSTTMADLRREMAAIRATDVVLQIDLPPGKFRMDGTPRADARPATPALILTFRTKLGAQSFPCDAFTRYEDNLRAIVLSLEALRKVDRYKVTKHGEQYRGFLALEGATAMPAGFSTITGAESFLWDLVRPHVADTFALKREELVRKAKRIAHPDTGGTAELFQRVTLAEQYLTTNGALA